MVSMHPLKICKMIDILHVLWKGIIVYTPDLGSLLKSWLIVGLYKGHHCTVAEALTQHGMIPTSPSNICKVLDKLHMLWMGI
jgi:hypothetical protein